MKLWLPGASRASLRGIVVSAQVRLSTTTHPEGWYIPTKSRPRNACAMVLNGGRENDLAVQT